MKVHTIIRIKKVTRDKLVKIGKKNESYDKIIQRLIGDYEL